MIMVPLNADRPFAQRVRRFLTPLVSRFTYDAEHRLRMQAEKRHASLRAVISHELREPLQMVFAEIDLLMTEPQAEACREGLAAIRRGLEREAGLIATLLDRYEPPAQHEAPQHIYGEKPRILLVDDHDNTRKAFTRIFWKAGFQVTPVASVREAIDAARSGDFLICDIGLEDGCGLDVMRAVAPLGIQGIAISGYGAKADFEASRLAGFAEHMTKPVDMDQIYRAIQEHSRVVLN